MTDISIGDRFGMLVVVGRGEDRIYFEKDRPKGKRSSMYICNCDCGKEIIVRDKYLKNGHTKSCGCKHITDIKNNVLQSNNTSGKTGVSFYSKINKWRASIVHNQKYIHLGFYENKNDAIKARLIAEEKYFN